MELRLKAQTAEADMLFLEQDEGGITSVIIISYMIIKEEELCNLTHTLVVKMP